MRHDALWLIRAFIASALLFCGCLAFAADERHPHHIAVAGGAGWQKSKTASFVGFDYAYRFRNDNYVGAFYEGTFGDFEIAAAGLLFGRHFGEHLKASIGPAIEYKLRQDKNLLLVRTQVGYDWHKGNWAFGPLVSYDIIEDETDAFYAGIAIGYGF